MKLSEGAKYEASLDAVLAGNASSTQIAEAKAIVFGTMEYLNDVSQRVGELETLMALLERLSNEGIIASDKVDAAKSAIDGGEVAQPAVIIQGNTVVVVADQQTQ